MMVIPLLVTVIKNGTLTLKLFTAQRARNQVIFKKMKVAIFHLGRCGSKLLINLLNEYSNNYIKHVGDPYPILPTGKDPIQMVQDAFDKDDLHPDNKHLFFDCRPFFEESLGEDKPINISLEEYIDRLKNELGIDKFVLIKRNNYMKRFVSSYKSQENMIWHITDNSSMEDKLKSMKPIHISQELVDYAKETVFPGMDEWYEFMESFCDEVIVYEKDIMNSPMPAYIKLCSLVDNPSSSNIRTAYQKTTPHKISQTMTNYIDLHDAFVGTKYEWMLKE